MAQSQLLPQAALPRYVPQSLRSRLLWKENRLCPWVGSDEVLEEHMRLEYGLFSIELLIEIIVYIVL